MTTSYLAMTDEDFLKQQAPEDEVVAIVETPVQVSTQVETPQVTEDKTQDTTTTETKVEDKDQVVEDTSDKATETTTKTETGQANPTGATGSDSTKTLEADKPIDGKVKEAVQDVTKDTAAATDYEGFYKQIMAPFKANGKMIELKTPAEALQLLQMGANYTAKMQALAPHRKVLLMLENNGLLDEGKLSYLIDLDKKNPEAIKKLIKDAGVDPHEIDTTVEPAYREGNHRVTDEEATFRTTLDDMKSNPTGLITLQAINTDWDQASKELLWKSPEVLGIIHEQRESGIYDRIVTEMNRQKTLGRIAAGTPFLQSYKTVGDQMVQANAFADLPAHKPAVQATPVAVATTVAAPKSTVTNNDQASAASQTRTTPKSAKEFINPLAMPDDEFLKQMKNRV